MSKECTLSLIKPDAVSKSVIGAIDAVFEKAGLSIVAMKMLHLTRAQAEAFYAIHRERPFFKALVDFMISGPLVAQVLYGEDAVMQNRRLMGDTNPKTANPGTIRA